MGVDRCVCREVRFETLLRLAREEGLSFEALRERTGCGGACGMCVPYIRIALATGRAEVPVLTGDFTTESRRTQREDGE